MNISTQNHQSIHTGHGSRNLLGSLLLGTLLVSTPFAAISRAPASKTAFMKALP